MRRMRRAAHASIQVCEEDFQSLQIVDLLVASSHNGGRTGQLQDVLASDGQRTEVERSVGSIRRSSRHHQGKAPTTRPRPCPSSFTRALHTTFQVRRSRRSPALSTLSRSPLAGFSSDTLLSIFCCLDFPTLVKATHTCRHWRDTALSFPAVLWCDVYSRCRKCGVVASLLQRSQGAPVTIRLNLHPSSEFIFDEAILAVTRHLDHVQS